MTGNPNTGKSTVFNALTGSRQEVGNWPGKTVEKKWGDLRYGKGLVVDLPGTYSLTAYSLEERIARNFIVEEKPDVVLDVVDASNLERNLYLAVQLIELGANLVIALNMMDVAECRGFRIDVEKLSELLGVPVIPTIASREKGIKELIRESAKTAKKRKRRFLIDYGKALEAKITELEKQVSMLAPALAEKYGARWIAIKTIEKDEEVLASIKKERKLKDYLRDHAYNEDADVEIAEKRYRYINGIAKKVVKRTSFAKLTTSDHIDKIVTNNWVGIPIFLLLMYVVYQLVFALGDPFVTMIGEALSWVAVHAQTLLISYHAPDWLVSLVISGMIEGIGNVLVFLPNILLLFAAIAILEDSGYMARAAFVMDRVMSKIGLHGKSFISLVLAFGCNVPAVMSVRTLENEKDRTITMLLSSLIPCNARMVVFVFIAGAFFEPEAAAQVVWSLVLLSFVLIMAMGWLFRKFLITGSRAPFVMELPPYHVPSLKAVVLHMWQRSQMFVKKAGTFILAMAIIMWFLAAYPEGVGYGSSQSYLGQLGQLFAPIFVPLGFDSITTVALLSGFVAKEVVISSFGVLYGVADEAALQQTIAAAWTPLQAYVFMVFTLLYIPCFATVAVIKKETGSWKWTLFAVGYTLALAWFVSFMVLQAGHLLGVG